jgi:hypothetical protein
VVAVGDVDEVDTSRIHSSIESCLGITIFNTIQTRSIACKRQGAEQKVVVGRNFFFSLREC